MSPADRFRGWIDSLSDAWKDRLRGWMASWLVRGVDELIAEKEPEIIGLTQDTLDKIKATPGIPPEMLSMLEKATTTGDIFSAVIGWMMTIIGAIPALFGLGAPLGRDWGYTQDRVIKSYRLDPLALTSIWLRDKPAYEKLWEDLKDQGWDDERIAVAKELSNIIPPLADMVRFADYSSFDPEVIAKWREFYDAPGWISEPFSLLGVTGEWADKYWFSHWVQPGRYELSLMHRRGLIDDDDVKLAYRTMGYSPYWQNLLLDLVKEVPTRVDVRRWWDLRTIDEAELRDVYHRQGYYGKDLDNYVLWTKVYVAFPDLMSRWSNGWITIDEVRSELTGLGMPADRVEEMIQTKIKTAAPGRVEGERDLTKTDIYKGVKTGAITRGEAAELLMDLGFDDEEADYLLTINIPQDEEDVVVVQRALTKADILKGLKTEVITRDQANDRLLALRYSAPDAEFLLKIFDAQVSPPVEPRLKEASKADILLGVKKGLISSTEGYGLLLDIGFTPEAADFILMVKAEESPFSPINFAEFKDLTQKYRRVAGMGVVYMTEEIKSSAAELVRLTRDVAALKEAVVTEQRSLVAGKILPESATKKLDALKVTLHRAEAELSAAKTQYDILIAQWRHGE